MKIHCSHHKMVPLKELTPHPKNRNKHPKEQIERLAKIIKFQGIRHPIKVSKRSGFITSGHGRLAAAKKLNLKDFPVDFQDYESDEQEYADVQSDNAIALWAELDIDGIKEDIGNFGPQFDADFLGLKDFLNGGEVVGLTDEDDIPEVQTEFTAKRGNIWALGEHRLMCGDSTADFNELARDQKIDFCFTSPPYSDQRDYCGGLDLTPGHIAKFLKSNCGLFAVNLGIQRKDGEIFQYWNDYFDVAKSAGLKLLSWNIWDKMECGGIGNQTAMFPIRHEWIFIFGKEKVELNKTLDCKHAGLVKTHLRGSRQKNGKLLYDDVIEPVGDKKKIETIISCSPLKARNHGLDHPAMFPVEFPEIYIQACTQLGATIYDPFCGSGTTLIAAEKLNRKCFAMEISEQYCDVIIKRWENFTGRKAELLNGPTTQEN